MVLVVIVKTLLTLWSMLTQVSPIYCFTTLSYCCGSFSVDMEDTPTSGTQSPEVVILDEEAPPTKKNKLDLQSDENESCVIIDSLSTTTTTTATTTSTTSNTNTATSSDIDTSSNSDITNPPLFYLTKVRGISNIYNGRHLAIGIKGTLCIKSIHTMYILVYYLCHYIHSMYLYTYLLDILSSSVGDLLASAQVSNIM